MRGEGASSTLLDRCVAMLGGGSLHQKSENPCINTGPDTSLYMLPYNPNKKEGVDRDSNV